jgi:hypothetical protein
LGLREITLRFDDEVSLRVEFKENLNWFKEEFDILFENRRQNFTELDKKIANQMLDQLSEIMNNYNYESFLFLLVSALNEIEEKYSGLF